MLSYYAGIGSRECPTDIVEQMIMYGRTLARLNLVLRSGGADGADTAFEQGCDEESGQKEIYLPWHRFNANPSPYFEIPPQAYPIAAEIYGDDWNQLRPSTKRFMVRNILQIIGQTLDQPVDFVICWTRDGCTDKEQRTRETGGTGQAIAFASTLNIPVFNLYNPNTETDITNFLTKMEYQQTTGC